MNFQLPPAALAAVYILAAIAPAAVLLVYIYRRDNVEKEPMGLLIKLLAAGCAATLLSILLEKLGYGLLRLLPRQEGPLFGFLRFFVAVAAVEEGAKFLLLKWSTWHHPAFNYRFDGIVYAVFVSLGFAALENVRYILAKGLVVALPRALLTVPGHMAFAVFMGFFYGRAKRRDSLGRHARARRTLWQAYLVPVVLHGLYNTCASYGTLLSTTVFLVFVALLFFTVFRLVRSEADHDMPI